MINRLPYVALVAGEKHVSVVMMVPIWPEIAYRICEKIRDSTNILETLLLVSDVE